MFKIKARLLKGKEIKYKYKKDGIYHDKVEKTKEYKNCINEVDRLVDEMLVGVSGKGSCFLIWDCKKKILKEKYNIDWRSPAEMNPDCKFD